MPSPADSSPGPRIALERAARVIAFAALGWLLIQAFRDYPAPVAERSGSGGLAPALRRWSTSRLPSSIHVRFDAGVAPSPFARDWLGALASPGTRITWENGGVEPAALAADAVADPEGGTLAWFAAPAGSRAVLSDPAGPLDSIVTSSSGARFQAPFSGGALGAAVGSTVARSAAPDSLILGRILVAGRVGWESKFVAAALEERGWKVDLHLALSPKGDVRQGVSAPLDTGRYSAVIVLDSGTVEPRAIAGYVRAGGGLVLAASAAREPALAALAAGLPDGAIPAVEPFDTLSRDPRRSLGLTPIALRSDAVVLERRGPLVAAAGRRVGRGRVITSGYEDSWRWRMSGGNDPVARHGDWWAGLVAGVAHTGRVRRAASEAGDEAPLAALFDRLGPPAAGPGGGERNQGNSRAWLFGLALGSLLLEWASRRFRGAR